MTSMWRQQVRDTSSQTRYSVIKTAMRMFVSQLRPCCPRTGTLQQRQAPCSPTHSLLCNAAEFHFVLIASCAARPPYAAAMPLRNVWRRRSAHNAAFLPSRGNCMLRLKTRHTAVHSFAHALNSSTVGNAECARTDASWLVHIIKRRH